MQYDAQILAEICGAIHASDMVRAQEIAEQKIPYSPVITESRKYTDVEALTVYVRDGFIDRYSGEKLVFPGTLRLLSNFLPEQIPYHPNWKTTECHMLFWYLSPTLDHLIPIARGGADDETNWVCTSMFRNQIKAHWTVEEIGWRLHSPGGNSNWDGLLGWYMETIDEKRHYLNEPFHQRWHRAAARVLGGV